MSDPSENTADSFKNKLGVSIIAFGTFLALVGGLNSLMYHPNPGGIISLLIGIVGVLYLIGATEKIVGLINHERSQQTQPSQGTH